MAIDFEQVLALKRELDDDYQGRHQAFRSLRRYWQGDYWRLADAESHPIASIFRDLTARTSDVGPDVKLVHNLLQATCLKYQSFFAPLPQIRMYPDPPETDRKRAQATTKERYLYGVWSMADMVRVNAWVAWYLPLMGNCFHGIFPDFDDKIPKALIRSPEYAYPVPNFQGEIDTYIFSWKVKESVVRRSFPKYVDEGTRQRMAGIFRKRGQEENPMVDLIEYSDCGEFSRWIAGQPVNRVQHDLGWNLFEHMKFIEVPDEVFGHGAVEQTVSLTEMGNALYSLMFQAVIENVFPRLVLIDPSKAPEELESGPGAVLPINQGGDAKFLTAPTQGFQFYEQFQMQNERNVKELSGMSGANFGESPASSIVTGKAVNALQGAGAGTAVELVQGTGIGPGLVAWNEKAIRIGQTLFKDDKINLYGMQPRTGYDLVPAKFSLSVKGSDLIGGTHNEVVFQPAISQHEKLVMWLQAKGGGIVSNKYIRDQVGIPDSDQMDQEIFNEAIDQGVLGLILQQFQAQPDAGQVENVEGQAVALLAGSTAPGVQAPAPSAHPLLGVPASPQPGPGGGAPIAPGAPSGPAPTETGQAPPGANTPQGATVDQVRAAVQGVKVSGRVFLVGEIVQRGQAEEVEMAITVPGDQQTLIDGLPQFHLIIHVVSGQPDEQFVDVTPGSSAPPQAVAA